MKGSSTLGMPHTSEKTVYHSSSTLSWWRLGMKLRIFFKMSPLGRYQAFLTTITWSTRAATGSFSSSASIQVLHDGAAFWVRPTTSTVGLPWTFSWVQVRPPVRFLSLNQGAERPTLTLLAAALPSPRAAASPSQEQTMNSRASMRPARGNLLIVPIRRAA